jgi:cytochrome c oxidase subunit II
MKRKIMPVVCAGLLAMAASAASVQAQAAPRRIEIDARRFSYSPGEITLKKGEPVILVLKSDDVAHGLRIRELNINLKTKAGGTAEMQFTPDKTGDFVGHCSVFCGEGHGSMAIKLHVVS